MKKIISKNKKNIILLILSIILIYSIIWSIYHFIISKNIAISAINSYLENIKINKEEIKSLEVKYDFKIGSQYNIRIRYKNEPNLEYRYEYRINKGKLISSSIENINFSKKIDKEIIPIHETHDHIKSLYNSNSSEFKIIEMKYSFFDYLKDLIYKKRYS